MGVPWARIRCWTWLSYIVIMATVNSYQKCTQEPVMPTPSRTSLDAITAAGGDILDTRGLPGLTMQAVAQAVGVKPPSLYKHVADRDALVGLVADAAATDLATHLAGRSGLAGLAGRGELAGLARSLRALSLIHPERFRLVFSGQGSPEVAAGAGAPLLKAARDLVGPADKLSAATSGEPWPENTRRN